MSKGFASDTGSSHRWLAGLVGWSVGSLPSAGVTRLRRSYEPVRPCASHRYSAPQGSAPWRSPLASRRQVPTFRTRASRWSHAVFMPVAARPVGRLPPSFGAGQQLEPGFGDVPTLSTRQQRFTRVRLTSAHLTGLIPPFPATLTTSAIGPTQLVVVWTLILQSEPEGPTLISCAARLPGVARYISHLLAPSWRTNHPVPYRRDAERPLAAPGLRDHHPPHRLGLVRLRNEVVPEPGQPPLEPVRLDRLERDLVHPRRAPVGTGERVGVAQNVRTIDLVVEQVEAEGRLRLRLEIQLPLEAPDPFGCLQVRHQSPHPHRRRKHARSQGPSLRRRYPASAVP